MIHTHKKSQVQNKQNNEMAKGQNSQQPSGRETTRAFRCEETRKTDSTFLFEV